MKIHLPLLLIFTLVLTLPVGAQTQSVITRDNATQLQLQSMLIKGNIRDLAASPDGQLLVVATTGGLAWYDLASSNVSFMPIGVVSGADFGNDGQFLAAVVGNNTIQRIDVASGAAQVVTTNDLLASADLQFSPDDASLLVTSFGNWAVLDATSGAIISNHDTEWMTSAFSPDGSLVAGVSLDDSQLIVSDTATGDEQIRISIENPDDVEQLIFSADNTLLYISQIDGVYAYRLADASLAGHVEFYNAKALALSPDGKNLGIGTYEGVQWVDAFTLTPLATLSDAFATHLAFIADGATFVLTTDADISLWDMASATQTTVFYGYRGEGYLGSKVHLAFSPDGTRMLTTEWQSIFLWDIIGDQPALLDTWTREWNVGTNTITFHPDGLRFGWFEDNLLYQYDPTTDEETTLVVGLESDYFSFSPDWRYCLYATGESDLRLVDLGTGDEVYLYGSDVLTSATFSPDGQSVIAGFDTGTVLVWDTASAEVVTELNYLGGGVTSVVLNSDLLTAAVAYDDNTIGLWNIETPQLLMTLVGHTEAPFDAGFTDIYDVAFSPDGLLLASAGNDQTVRVWDVTTGQLLTTLAGHTGPVTEVEFSPDGSRIASFGFDSTIRLWGIP